MATRITGVIAASALACALVSGTLGTSYAADLGAPAQSADGTCFGEPPTEELLSTEDFTGTDEVDVVIGGDQVLGMGGNDLICGATYADGGDGDDRIEVHGIDTALGGAGDDEFVALAVSGTDSTEAIFGGGGVDVVWAGGGNDLVKLGRGNDQGFGQIGDDVFKGGSGDDVVDGGPGLDRVRGGTGDNRCQNVGSRFACPVR
jgi:Ca2+-binding RTX toxin-like protein